MDIGTFEVSTDLHFDKAKKDGLPTEEESLKLLIKQEIWSNEKEEKIKKLRLSTAILQDTHKKLFLKGQIAKSQKMC